MVDMQVKAFLLGSTLVAVAAQRLARKICKNCREEIKVSEKYKKEVLQVLEGVDREYIKTLVPDFSPDNIRMFKGKGCSRCGNSGYSGRLSVSEVMTITDELKEKILEGKKYVSLKDIRESQTYLSVKQDGVLKVLQGITTYEEVLRVMRD
jgi:type II secretory ATPase GspE/PulE/Tfp pilus assembly ATPase PilB-like protein